MTQTPSSTPVEHIILKFRQCNSDNNSEGDSESDDLILKVNKSAENDYENKIWGSASFDTSGFKTGESRANNGKGQILLDRGDSRSPTFANCWVQYDKITQRDAIINFTQLKNPPTIRVDEDSLFDKGASNSAEKCEECYCGENPTYEYLKYKNCFDNTKHLYFKKEEGQKNPAKPVIKVDDWYVLDGQEKINCWTYVGDEYDTACETLAVEKDQKAQKNKNNTGSTWYVAEDDIEKSFDDCNSCLAKASSAISPKITIRGIPNPIEEENWGQNDINVTMGGSITDTSAVTITHTNKVTVKPGSSSNFSFDEERVVALKEHGDTGFDDVLLIFFTSVDSDLYRTMPQEDPIRVNEGTSGGKTGGLKAHKSDNVTFIEGSQANNLDEWWADPLVVQISYNNFKSTDSSVSNLSQIINLTYPSGYPWFSGSLKCTGPNSKTITSFWEYKEETSGTVTGSKALTPANLGWANDGDSKSGKATKIACFNFLDQSLVSATFIIDISYTNKNLGYVKMTPEESVLTHSPLSDEYKIGRGDPVANPIKVSSKVPATKCYAPNSIANEQIFLATYNADSSLPEGNYTLSQKYHIGVHHEDKPRPDIGQKLECFILFKVQKSSGEVKSTQPTKNKGKGKGTKGKG